MANARGRFVLLEVPLCQPPIRTDDFSVRRVDYASWGAVLIVLDVSCLMLHALYANVAVCLGRDY
jgi:hypothetical protein